MGTLKEKIQNELNQAVKSKNETVSSVLRMFLAAILNKEKEKRYKISKEQKETKEKELVKKSQLTDEEIIELLASEIKKRKEAILEFEKGGREELVKKEKAEIEVLEKYLPEQISEEELKKLAKEAVEKTGAREIKDMGKVMGELMPQIKGRADGALASRIVKEILAGK